MLFFIDIKIFVLLLFLELTRMLISGSTGLRNHSIEIKLTYGSDYGTCNIVRLVVSFSKHLLIIRHTFLLYSFLGHTMLNLILTMHAI